MEKSIRGGEHKSGLDNWTKSTYLILFSLPYSESTTPTFSNTKDETILRENDDERGEITEEPNTRNYDFGRRYNLLGRSVL